jgi:hypothetical protein
MLTQALRIRNNTGQSVVLVHGEAVVSRVIRPRDLEWLHRRVMRTQPAHPSREKRRTRLAVTSAWCCAAFTLAMLYAGQTHPPEPGTTGPARASSPPSAGKCRLRIEVLDQISGRVIPGRIYVTDSAGKPWAPENAIRYDKGPEHHFISPGTSELLLPPGTYSIAAERGPEYRPWSARVEAKSGQEIEMTAHLARWIPMNQRGWFSGDLHDHRPLAQTADLLLAEDLNLAPVINDWIWKDKPIASPQNSEGRVQVVDPAHAYSTLNKEIERLEHGPGAVDLLNLRSPVPFRGYRLAPPNDGYCRLAREQGGYVDAEKIVWRDTAALVALGLVDFAGIVHNHFNRHGVDLETDPWGMIPKDRPEYDTIAGMPLWSMDVYYRLLNCGFRLPVSAGSASGVKPAPLGYNRVYVKLDQEFSYDGWFRALKAGRSFATNGPMLFLTVDANGPGAALQLAGQDVRKLRIHAEAVSPRGIDRLEIVSNGQVVKAISHHPGKMIADFEYEPRGSGWIAARCFERPDNTIRFAHTSPVYVQVDGKSGIVPDDAAYFVRLMDRAIDFYRKEPGFKSQADREAMIGFFEQARTVYAKLAGNQP